MIELITLLVGMCAGWVGCLVFHDWPLWHEDREDEME
jgi:hypothetical protein